MPVARCPTLEGRDEEMARLRTLVENASTGGVVALTGPAGIGKSRLTRAAADTARRRGLPVLVGRAVGTGSATAFRPLAEALVSGLRGVDAGAAVTGTEALRPFLPALSRLVPTLVDPVPAVPDQDVALGEAVRALLGELGSRGAPSGVLLIVEDLHWADPETLAVLEYVADNLEGTPVAVLLTTRDDKGPATGVVDALARRGALTSLPLRPLDDEAVGRMLHACRGEVEDVLLSTLRRRAGGVPLLVEELLSEDIDPATTVPTTVTALIGARLPGLSGGGRRTVEAAAVLGAQVPWRLLSPTTGLDAARTTVALREVVDAGLLEPADDLVVRFPHVLERDAVLATLLPPELAHLAERALSAVLDAHPRLEGHWADLAADLALRARDDDRAARLLLDLGRRNLALGALVSAEAVLRRARSAAGREDELVAEIDDALAEVLARAGKVTEAVAATERCVARWRGLPDGDGRLARAFLRLARVHAAAGDWRSASAVVATARVHTPTGTVADVEAVDALVALGEARLDDARRLADTALLAEGSAEAHCEALTVLARLARREDPATSEALLLRARTTARAAGLVLVALHAQEELAIGDVQEDLRPDRLDEARAQAVDAGDLAAVAVLDLQAIALYHARGEPEPALAAAGRCISASRRLGLATLPKALVLSAFAHDCLHHRQASEAAVAEALALAPDDVHLAGEAAGIAAMRALTDADDVAAAGHLDRAMVIFGSRAHEVTGSPTVGLWVLVTAFTGNRSAPVPPDPVTNRWNRGLVRFADAIVAGRDGDAPGARAAFDEADATMRTPVRVTWFLLVARRLVAWAALRDGWGDPVPWARDDLPVVVGLGHDRWAADLRTLLRRAGAPVARDHGAVTPELGLLGVTAREAEVLDLVAEGLGNRAIATRLVLSPRTVEKHVERLLAKTDVPTRAALVAFAVRATG